MTPGGVLTEPTVVDQSKPPEYALPALRGRSARFAASPAAARVQSGALHLRAFVIAWHTRESETEE